MNATFCADDILKSVESVYVCCGWHVRESGLCVSVCVVNRDAVAFVRLVNMTRELGTYLRTGPK